jgi:hypothetical protein
MLHESHAFRNLFPFGVSPLPPVIDEGVPTGMDKSSCPLATPLYGEAICGGGCTEEAWIDCGSN